MGEKKISQDALAEGDPLLEKEAEVLSSDSEPVDDDDDIWNEIWAEDKQDEEQARAELAVMHKEKQERKKSIRDLKRKYDLTEVETYQIEKKSPGVGESWFMKEQMQRTEKYTEYFRENPESRKIVIRNPFGKEALKIIEDIATTEGDEEIIVRAAIIVEDKEEYDNSFDELSKGEKEEALYEQIDLSANVTVRLKRYVEENIEQVNDLDDKELYEVLCQVAFETDDQEDIQEKYSLSQRRGFRLSVVNFIENRRDLSPYKDECLADPKEFAQKYLEKTFHGEVRIEILPVGFIVYLESKDYAQLEIGKSILSAGKTLLWSSFPKALRGRLIVINNGTSKTETRSDEAISKTKKHELGHILFEDFHATEHNTTDDVEIDLSDCKTEEEYRRASDAIYKSQVEGAKDEIVAYFSEGGKDPYYEDLRFDLYEGKIKEVKKVLTRRSDLTIEQKQRIMGLFYEDRDKCFQTIRSMKVVAQKLDEQSEKGAIDKDKAEALLRIVPGAKIDRLARYAGLEVKSGDIVKEKDKRIIGELNALANAPKRYDEAVWDRISKNADEIKEELSPEYLPVLLKVISKWSKSDWTSLFVEYALSSVGEIIKLHGMSEAEKQRVEEVCQDLIEKKSDNEKFEKVVESAGKLLASMGEYKDLDFKPASKGKILESEPIGGQENKPSKRWWQVWK